MSAFSRNESGIAALETSLIMFPYLLLFTSFIVVAQWLTSLGTVTMESMTVNLNAVAAFNQNGGAGGNAWGWTWQNLFINHPNAAHTSEAQSYAQSDAGFTPGDLFQEACMNFGAGVASRTGTAFGLTPVPYGYNQIGLRFSNNWVSVERRVTRNITLRAQTVDLMSFLVL